MLSFSGAGLGPPPPPLQVGDPNLHFVEQVALAPPEVQIDLQQQQEYEKQLQASAAPPGRHPPAAGRGAAHDFCTTLHCRLPLCPHATLHRDSCHRGPTVCPAINPPQEAANMPLPDGDDDDIAE